MGRDAGVDVVIGVPEVAVVVGRPIAVGVVQVHVDHVRGQIVHERPPAPIARSNVLGGETRQRVVLIVVMGTQSLRTLVADRLVIGVEIAEVPPAVLVGDFPLALEALLAVDRAANDLFVLTDRSFACGGRA